MIEFYRNPGDPEPDENRKACVDCRFMQGASVSLYCVNADAKGEYGFVWNRSISGCDFWQPLRIHETLMYTIGESMHQPIEPLPLPNIRLYDYPSSRFQRFKQKFYPKWALKRWPVKTNNHMEEVLEMFEQLSGVANVQRGGK